MPSDPKTIIGTFRPAPSDPISTMHREDPVAAPANAAPTSTAEPEHSSAAPMSDRFVSIPPPSVSQTSWKQYVNVPQPLRTWLTHAMMYVENTIEFLQNLQVSDLTPEMQHLLRSLGKELELIVEDLKSPYLDNGSLSLLGLERIQNMLFRVGHGSIMRVNINMTDANKIDPSGNLGTAFRQVVLEWLQDKFGNVHITQNPEATSFLAIDVRKHVIDDQMGRFARDIEARLRREEITKQYNLQPAMLDAFQPRATGMVMRLTGEGLTIQETLDTRDRALIMDLQERMISRIEESLRLLAVSSTLAEKRPEAINLASGAAVYSVTDLPLTPGTRGYELLKEQYKLGLGYVPASVHFPHRAREASATDVRMRQHPRHGHNFGQIDHPKRPGNSGGALQILQKALNEAAVASDDFEKQDALSRIQEAADRFSPTLSIGRMARANPRNPLFVKWEQLIHLSDGTHFMDPYFLENLAMRPEPSIHLAMVELDSFKAFSLAYPVDEGDSHFWGIFDAFFDVAHEMRIDPPILTQVAGDLVAAAIPTVDQDGNPTNLERFLKHVQHHVVEAYRDKPFQDYTKREVTDEKGTRVERWPLWQIGDLTFPFVTRPKHGKAYMRTLSITAVATTIERPTKASDGEALMRLKDEMASQIEVLKEKLAPQKGGFALMTPPPTTKKERSRNTGYFMPRTDQEGKAGMHRFASIIDRQLHTAWGEHWDKLDRSTKKSFLSRLYQEAPTMPPILTPDAVVSIFSNSSCGRPASLPALPPMLFIPAVRVMR